MSLLLRWMKNWKLRSALFWDVIQHRIVSPYWHFGTTCWSLLQGSRNPLKMGPIGCPEISVVNNHSMLHNIAEVKFSSTFWQKPEIKQRTKLFSCINNSLTSTFHFIWMRLTPSSCEWNMTLKLALSTSLNVRRLCKQPLYHLAVWADHFWVSSNLILKYPWK